MSHPAALESLLLAFRSPHPAARYDICWPWKAAKLWKGTADCWVATDTRRLILIPVARLENPVFDSCILPADRKDPPAIQLGETIPAEIWTDNDWRDLDECAPQWRESLKLASPEDGIGYSLAESTLKVCNLAIPTDCLFDLLPHRPLFKRAANGRLLVMGDAFRAIIKPHREPQATE
jgi:hypothetical protein